MTKMLALEGSEAVAIAAKLANVDVVCSYPITPQTHIVERLADYIANGELDAEFIKVESEHSALSACIGAAAAGSRTFTATSSQGLALMHEMLYIASGNRLPIAMAVVNRALSAPLNIWCDHSDSMTERDSGWPTVYVEGSQEALDMTLQIFKISEDERVLLPVMVCLDGFVLSHVIENVIVPDPEKVAEFLPTRKQPYLLDPKNPITFGAVAPPNYFFEFKRQQEEAMLNARRVIKEVNDEYCELFERKYGDGFIETVMTEDAEVVLITLGSMTGTARVVIDILRKAGKRVGLIKLRFLRPFPTKEISKAIKNAKVVAVVSRDLSFGAFGGAAVPEVRAALYELPNRPHVVGFVVGLGGRDIRILDFEEIVEKAFDVMKNDRVERDFEFIGVRE